MRRVALLVFLCCPVVFADNDWSQWLGGAARTNAVDPPGWQSGKTPRLKVLWRQPLGSGYSSIAVRDGYIAVQMTAGSDDVVALRKASTGEELWRTTSGPKYAGHDGSIDGPLSTPAIDDDAVYALGPRGRLLCLQRSDGSIRWEVDLKRRFSAKEPHYGFATSPLLFEDKVILQVGGSGLLPGKALAALDRRTGAVLWETQSDLTGYSSPTAVTLDDVPQIVVQADKRVFAVTPVNGALLWEIKVPASSWTPLPVGPDRLFLSTEDRSRLLQIRQQEQRWQIETIWQSKHLDGVINAITATDEALFGVSNRALTCVDLKDGTLRWSSERDSFPLRVGDLLLALEDRTGTLLVVRAGTERYEELAALGVYKVSGGTRVESPMAFADGVLYIRTDFSLVAVRVDN